MEGENQGTPEEKEGEKMKEDPERKKEEKVREDEVGTQHEKNRAHPANQYLYIGPHMRIGWAA